MELRIEKNIKWVAIVLTVLFVFKTVQSCNRGAKINTMDKKHTQTVDSLKSKNETAQDSIKRLNFELKLASERVKSATERANAVQSTAEKMKANTTVVVKGVEKENK